eukprot:COSAG02_NODE_2977_length_7630_cov_6.628735_3_plen_77_part_00
MLANEIWGSGRELPLVFISWDVIKLWNDHVPTLFVVPRPELVVPSVSKVCSDAQMVKFIELAAKDNVDGAVLESLA